ncbi:hypothetical protein P154DRAFT_570872 [Amniculicola lignicola CBS 123094]|uniref:Zn(2)-C6 fungal-type domain-containing protein n=1 Tax=Amniculicola lignicola CBS 123094 TaxID=1392246 RepID=A0A6A5X2J4_9PLEO|nr:hypothetical protein P154DRAFT_570872 [Amniculicola lignicola CBS 123094]
MGVSSWTRREAVVVHKYTSGNLVHSSAPVNLAASAAHSSTVCSANLCGVARSGQAASLTIAQPLEVLNSSRITTHAPSAIHSTQAAPRSGGIRNPSQRAPRARLLVVDRLPVCMTSPTPSRPRSSLLRAAMRTVGPGAVASACCSLRPHPRGARQPRPSTSPTRRPRPSSSTSLPSLSQRRPASANQLHPDSDPDRPPSGRPRRHRPIATPATSVRRATIAPKTPSRSNKQQAAAASTLGMQVSSLLADSPVLDPQRSQATCAGDSSSCQQGPRQMAPPFEMDARRIDTIMTDVYPTTETYPAHEAMSPTKVDKGRAKYVSFELLLQQQGAKARLPMRVNIYPHDTTESIITTVKNFYGLYERCGVTFQDRNDLTLIARYENFTNDMVVYVSVVERDSAASEASAGPRESASPRRARLEEASARVGSHAPQRQSPSPQPGRGRRSESATTYIKPRSRPIAKSRATSSHGSFADAHIDVNGYSDSEGGNASVTSSRRGKKEHLASAEISVDNIVEGGRRKRAKFDSSELPLFVPPQVPMTASLSSVSPQRRISSHNGASPYSLGNQQTFAFSHPLPSPQSYGHIDSSYLQGLATPYSNSSARNRASTQYASYRHSVIGSTVMATPDLTLASASVISDEDVARQLMRLGDASNFSTHGRTSTSTLDDALSGKAEAASSSEESDECSDDEDHELPPLPFTMAHNSVANATFTRIYDSGETSGEEYEDQDESFKGESDEIVPDELQGHRLQNGIVRARSTVSSKAGKSHKSRGVSKTKSKPIGPAKQPISPASMPPASRKTSNASISTQAQLAIDEEDLSTKPRCQRCRKSKKGCDRQRPCQRCKDAGIGIEGCVSEDEGNGRKGRYGRHMGVTVKKNAMDPPPLHDHGVAGGPVTYSHSVGLQMDKSKKRKR